MTKPLPADWRDLLNTERKALTFKDLPEQVQEIFTKRINSKSGGSC